MAKKQHKKAIKAVQTFWKVKSDKGGFSGATYFGHDRLWPTTFPILATTCFGHGVTDFGHDQFWAFSRVRKGMGRVGRMGPRLGGRRVGRRGGDPTQKSVGARRVGARRVEGPKISRFFFPSPTPIFILFFSLWGSSRVFFSLCGCLLVSFFLSLGVFSWNFGGVLVGRDLKCGCFRPQVVVWKPPAACRPPGFHGTEKKEKRHEKTLGERKTREDPQRRNKKREILGGLASRRSYGVLPSDERS